MNSINWWITLVLIKIRTSVSVKKFSFSIDIIVWISIFWSEIDKYNKTLFDIQKLEDLANSLIIGNWFLCRQVIVTLKWPRNQMLKNHFQATFKQFMYHEFHWILTFVNKLRQILCMVIHIEIIVLELCLKFYKM